MAPKVTYSFLKNISKLLCNSKTNTFSRLFCISRTQYSSNEDSGDSGEKNLKKLLKSASPLKSNVTLDVDNELWATSAYPPGTVFRESEDVDKEIEETMNVRGSVTESVIMFPGQGNQFVGMAKNLLKYPVAVDLFNTAKEVLKYDLLSICLNGPEEKLNKTEYCQPATFVCSLGLLEKIKEERPWAISNCIATCGYSLGELTALVFAGCVNFEQGLRLVKVRAEAMSKCCKKYPGGMLTLFTGPKTKLTDALSAAVEHCHTLGINDPQCVKASYLYTNCKVIAGNIEAIEFLEKNAKNFGIRRHSRLPVAGAFHTLLMAEAAEVFKEELKKVTIQPPLTTLYSNVSAKPYRNPKDIIRKLPKQIYTSVKWEQTIQHLFRYRKGQLPFVYECGPGSSLTATISKTNMLAAPNTYAIRL